MPKNSVIVRKLAMIQLSPILGKPKISAKGTRDSTVRDREIPDSTEPARMIMVCSGAPA